MSRPELVVGNLDAERDFSDVRDVVHAYEQLMASGRGSTPYNVCSGKALRVGDLLDRLVRLARLKIDVVVDRARLRPSDTPRIVGDATRIKRDVGWTPEIPIERTLEDTLDWWRVQVRKSA
jgi:GDP-4-dehydro-6-deoxy-D-mannose reductase